MDSIERRLRRLESRPASPGSIRRALREFQHTGKLPADRKRRELISNILEYLQALKAAIPKPEDLRRLDTA